MIAVAIDGPAGAGKSTISRRIAQSLGYIYVDTGALYRAVGFYCLQHDVACTQEQAVRAVLPEIEIELKFEHNEQCVYLCRENITAHIRTPEVSMAASAVSALPAVRAFLFDLQQELARKHNVVMDGRDIGTVVLPHAQVKIFLTATPEDRARRRYEEMVEKGMKADYQAVLEDLKVRDYNDSHREIAPLKPADDAVVVDTTGNTLEQSVGILLDLVKEKLA